jgi:hypothetical protein
MSRFADGLIGWEYPPARKRMDGPRISNVKAWTVQTAIAIARIPSRTSTGGWCNAKFGFLRRRKKKLTRLTLQRHRTLDFLPAG